MIRMIAGLALAAVLASVSPLHAYSVLAHEAAIDVTWDEIVKLTPSVERSAFVFAYPRADFEKDYGRDYQKPGLFARFLGVLYRVVPKIGPLRPLAFKAPTVKAQALFAESFRQATARMRADMRDISSGQFSLRNTNFDTGRPSRHGEYVLADDTYAELLDRLSARQFADTPMALTRHIITFYGDGPRPSPASRKDQKRWARIERALQDLRRSQPEQAPGARTGSTTAQPE